MGNMSKGNTDEAVKMKFIEWLKVPKQKRREMNKIDPTFPVKEAEFADKYGIHRVTLWRWKNDGDFQKLLRDEKFQLLGHEEFEAAMAIWKEQMKSDFKVFKQMVEWSGVLDKPKESFDEDEDIEMLKNMSDEEIMALIAEEDMGEDDAE